MPRIGELLIQRGACDEAAIREALENQIIFGGRLGTNLLETGAVTEQALAAALGEKYGVPHLAGELEIDPDAVALLRAEVADRFDVVPYVVSERRLGLLCIDPTDLNVMDEVAFVTGRNVHPIVVAEARLWILLKDAYHIERQLRAIVVRFASLKDHKTVDPADERRSPTTGEVFGAGPAVAAARRRPSPPPGPPGPPPRPPGPAAAVELEEPQATPAADLIPEEPWSPESAARPPAARPPPPPPSLELPAFTRDLLARLAVEAGHPPGGAAPAPPPPAPAREPADVGPLALEAALPAIEAATHRDDIARVLLRHARGPFRRAMLFVVQGPLARGWVAAGEGLGAEAPLGLELPLAAPGIVASAVERGEPLVAPLLHAESDVRLVERLGGGAPSEAVAVPIATHGRVVNVLYADAGPGGVASPEAVDELAAVATFAARRYEALLGRI